MSAPLRTVDLPEELRGSLCVWCDAMGEHRAAEWINRHDEGLCSECFADSLRIELLLSAGAAVLASRPEIAASPALEFTHEDEETDDDAA